MKFDGIIFDLDGTLWDSCRSVAESWHLTLTRRFGIKEAPSLSEIQSIMGMTASEIARALFTGIGEDPAYIFEVCGKEECDYLSTHGGIVYPGVEEMLQALSRRHPLFLVSNCRMVISKAFSGLLGFSSTLPTTNARDAAKNQRPKISGISSPAISWPPPSISAIPKWTKPAPSWPDVPSSMRPMGLVVPKNPWPQ